MLYLMFLASSLAVILMLLFAICCVVLQCKKRSDQKKKKLKRERKEAYKAEEESDKKVVLEPIEQYNIFPTGGTPSASPGYVQREDICPRPPSEINHRQSEFSINELPVY